MQNRFRHTCVRSALFASTMLASTATYAQTATTPAAPAAAAPKETGGLEDIVVTARKKVENLQNIPIAETVVSSAQLQHYNITSIEKMANLAPQLVVARSGTGNGASVGLRGISVNSTSVSLEQSVAVIIDGVYYSGGRALNEGIFDLSQAEVLKGPQSLFYGKNTTAGALSFTTADPTRTFQAMAKGGYEFNAKQPYFEGYVSGPLTDTLSGRIAGRFSHQFGALIDNVAPAFTSYTHDIATGVTTAHPTPAATGNTPGEQQGIVRASLKWEPTDRLTATVKSTYNNYKADTPNLNTVINYCGKGYVQTDPTGTACGHQFVQTQQALAPDIAASDKLLGAHGGAPYLDYESYNVAGNIAYHGEKVDLSVVPAYVHWTNQWRGDQDFTNAYLTRAPNLGTGGNATGELTRQSAESVEARAQTRFGGILNFMAGGYYQHSNLFFQQDNVYPGGAENSAVTDPSLRYLTIRKLGFTHGNTYAGFGQILLDITSNLNITGGARYTHETKNSQLAQPYVIASAQGTYREGAIGADQSFNNFSPEATITWKPTRHITAYASYKTGYKSGGFSISGLIATHTTAADATFQPEKVSGFEGGIKSTLLDNQLRVNFDLFDYLYKNLQVDYLDSTLIQYFTLNAGKARTKGAELEMEYAPRGISGLTMRFSGAYTDAKYTSFNFAPCLAGQTPLEGCSLGATPNGTRNNQNLSGQSLQQAPKWVASFGPDYTRPIGGGLKAGISANFRYSSRYKTDPFASDAASRYYQHSYGTIDANIRLGQEDDKWEVDLIGKNLTNHFIITQALDANYTGSGTGTAAGVHADERGSVSDPRTVAIEATFRF